MTGHRGVTAPRLLRAVGVGSILYGAVLLVAPAAAVGAVGGAAPRHWIIRVLGARQIAQGVGLLLHPAGTTVAGSAAVDGLHALTMVAAALRWPAYRRAAAASGAVACASGALAAASTA